MTEYRTEYRAALGDAVKDTITRRAHRARGGGAPIALLIRAIMTPISVMINESSP